MSRARDTADQINRVNSSAADATAITVDSSENVLVGKATSSGYTNGIELRPYGLLAASRDSSAPVLLNRTTNDGDIITLAKDGTTVGSIQSRAGVVSTIILDPRSGSIGTGITGSGANLSPTNGSGVEVDARNDLGKSDYRFKDAYLSGGIYLGGTGSANKLDDYEEGTWTPAGHNYTGSFSNVRASYIKIGNKVFIDLFMNTTDDSSETGAFRIYGLPFSSDGTTNAYSTFASMSYNNPNGTAIAGCQIIPGVSYIRMLKKTSATSPTWADWQGRDVNSGEINLSFSYTTS